MSRGTLQELKISNKRVCIFCEIRFKGTFNNELSTQISCLVFSFCLTFRARERINKEKRYRELVIASRNIRRIVEDEVERNERQKLKLYAELAVFNTQTHKSTHTQRIHNYLH